MMWKAKWSRFTECFCRRPGLVLVLLPCLLIVTLYLVSGDNYEYDAQYPSLKSYNVAEGESPSLPPPLFPSRSFDPLASWIVTLAR